jgi:PAS domain S-box-containing protein
VQANTEPKLQIDQLVYLPSFAQYLLDNKLSELSLFQLEISRENQLPLMKYLEKLPADQLMEVVVESIRDMLWHLASGRISEFIESSVEQYRQNQLPGINQEEIEAKDITLVIYARRKGFLHFLPDFTQDSEVLIATIKEIDLFLLQLETKSFSLHIELLKKKNSESRHFIEKITSTSPGIIYVFDLEKNKTIYSNRPLREFLGYGRIDDHENGGFDIEEFLFPEDLQVLEAYKTAFENIAEGETRSLKIRLLNGQGEFRWIRCFETVFRRNAEGKLVEKIGIAIDVHEQKIISEQLQKREAELLEAQEIAKIGSFTWDMKGKNSYGSEQTKSILEVDFGDQEAFFSHVHPDDKPKMQDAIQNAIETGSYDCEYRYQTSKGEKIIWTRGIIHYEQGEASYMNGTIMDVSEKQILIQQLRHQQELYKQVEELANMGNWSWDLRTNKLEWTDHLYRIYGLDPQQEEITIEKFLSFIQVPDVEKVRQSVESIQTEKNIDYTFRIMTRDGKLKFIRSIAKVEKDKEGNPTRVIGTERDVTERQNILNNLRLSESLYKQAQALAHIGNWTWQIETDVVEWSEELYRIYEIPQGEQLSLEKIADFMHPDEKEEVLNYIDECIREHKLYDRAHRIVLKNGKEKVVHRRAEVIREEGKPLIMVGTTQDITEIYHVQQALRENQNLIRKITDATPSVITTYNVNTGAYLFISEGLHKLMGYEVEDAMEKGAGFFKDIIHPEDLPMVLEKNSKALEVANNDPEKKDLIVEFTYRIRHKNGDYRWFITYGTIFDRNQQGMVEHVLNITLDVSDQKLAVQKIKEQEHFIQQIADASPTILYLYEVETQSIVYINREIFFVLGYTPNEILNAGSDITSLLYHPEDYHHLPARKESSKNFSQVDSMMQYECRMRTKDNEWRWVLVREIVFKTDSNGDIQQILGAALDINRRKEMEKTILQNTVLLEQSNSSLEEFAYVASHDLKEPLRKISTFGDRLAASHMEMFTPEGKLYMNKILDASQRMQTMISDLLSISMITGNRSFEKYSLQKILEETLQTLEYKLEQLNAVVNNDGLPEANIIPSQFRQLFQNLLSNSLKFTREGVQPVISITHSLLKEKDIVHYQLTPAEKYLKIIFKDNGIGFENEFAHKIFAIFQRLHGRSEYEGSGIGLAICKKIVEHHGGVIYAEGALDEGATFTIILPA